MKRSPGDVRLPIFVVWPDFDLRQNVVFFQHCKGPMRAPAHREDWRDQDHHVEGQT